MRSEFKAITTKHFWNEYVETTWTSFDSIYTVRITSSVYSIVQKGAKRKSKSANGRTGSLKLRQAITDLTIRNQIHSINL